MELHAGRGPAVSTRWVDLCLFYLLQLSPVRGSRPGKVVHRWVTEKVPAGSGGRGGCRGTVAKNRLKPIAPTLHLHPPAPHRRATRGCSKKLLVGRFAQTARCTPLTAVGVPPGRHAAALPGRAVCPANVWCPAVGSLEFGAVDAPALVRPCEHRRAVPPPSAPAAAWAPWPYQQPPNPQLALPLLGGRRISWLGPRAWHEPAARGLPLLAGDEMASLGKTARSAEHKGLDEVKRWSVPLFPTKAMAVFCIVILLTTSGLHHHKQQPCGSTENLVPWVR